MQPLTAPPREHLTAEQVMDLLTGDEVTVSAGLELLDSRNRFVADISDSLGTGGKVTHHGRDRVHGACSLPILQPLAWGRDRVLVYMTLSNAAVSARFNVGVYVLTTPQDKRGETPATFDVQGYDLLQPLLDPIGDTYVVLPEQGDELWPNTGYETDVSGVGSSDALGAYTPAVSIARSTTRASAGSASMLVTWPTGANSWANADATEFVVGKTYKFITDLWVPASGPDDFRFDIVFVSGSPWFTPTKETWVTVEWLWTATVASGFPGIATRGTTSGQQTWIDETHIVGQSTTCLDAVRTVIELAGGGAPLLIDGTQQVAVLPGPMVWALTESNPTSWLDVCDDLLDAVGYGRLWVDQDGNYRSEPYQSAIERPVSWTFDLADEKTNLVGPDRVSEQDVWDLPNRWKFIRRNMNVEPVEGDGIYTIDNVSRGPSSQVSLGRVRRKTVFVDAVDQASLVAQGDRAYAEDTAAARSVQLQVDPLPIAGHLDVVRYLDSPDAVLAEVASWELPLDGGQGEWVLEVVE